MSGQEVKVVAKAATDTIKQNMKNPAPTASCERTRLSLGAGRLMLIR
ncbi:MAG: hypothetical protein IPK04_17705 [Bdellovibrionales bacterium]|nr:hypothetical protein [Bdellovibrionales bacterium]